MRLAPLALVTALAGCAGNDPSGITAMHLESDWIGTFESDDGCEDGEVTLSVEELGDGVVAGTLDYIDLAHGHAATYEVEGDLADGNLVFDEVVLQRSDDLDYGMWCFGEYELSLDEPGPDGQRPLGGWYGADDCSCTGTMDLVADN